MFPDTLSAKTVILHVAVNPLAVFAVIVVFPALLTFTFPLFTVATAGLLLVQVMVLFFASEGVMVAVSVSS